jgi:hypothetical protein
MCNQPHASASIRDFRLQKATAMNKTSSMVRPIEAGVFADLQLADQAVAALLDAGFDKEHITVICSDAAVQRHFSEFEHQDPAGAHTTTAVMVGGAIGAVLGGLTTAVGAVATGGLALMATAGAVAWTGGVFGGLVGAMMTRGVEKELANYYDQAVARGKILVAGEADAHDATARQQQQLALAKKVLSEAGAEPVPLVEG